MTVVFAAEMSDRNDRIDAARPHVYGGSIEVASLRAFRRYQKDATWDIPDAEGILRWVTRKQMRVYGIIARISLSPGGTAKMVDIAHEAQCSTATVSRTILKVQAWGLYAVDVRRGRNGGITVWKAVGSRFRMYRKAARQKLREMAIRARIKLASVIPWTEDAINTTLFGRDESFRPRAFVDRVFYERAMLALEDPEGEYDALHPLIGTEAVDEALILADDERRRQDLAIREAAFAGDWDRWEMLRKIRWDVAK